MCYYKKLKLWLEPRKIFHYHSNITGCICIDRLHDIFGYPHCTKSNCMKFNMLSYVRLTQCICIYCIAACLWTFPPQTLKPANTCLSGKLRPCPWRVSWQFLYQEAVFNIESLCHVINSFCHSLCKREKKQNHFHHWTHEKQSV